MIRAALKRSGKDRSSTSYFAGAYESSVAEADTVADERGGAI
ncbi:MAG TPA: hypothetical protein VGG60_10355 [Candidatus Binataceae bacterium]